MGFVWSVPTPLKEMTGRGQTGGGGRIIVAGSKPLFFQEGSYVFPSPEFPPYAAL